MAKIIRAKIKPGLLTWAREQAFMSLDEVAAKLGITNEKFQSWEEGLTQPTINQLRHLARILDQPFAVFYLPEPPKVYFPKIRDFRRLPSGKLGRFSSEVLFEIRRAVDRRQIALELIEETGEDPTYLDRNIPLLGNLEDSGINIRKLAGVAIDEQKHWRDTRIAFNRWRDKIESLGILVFQADSVALEETRGFSIHENLLPIIVVNRKDAYAGRIFTMIHELVHILLRTSGMCDLDPNPSLPPEEQGIEVFCNQVAAEVLVPKKDLLSEELLDFWGDPSQPTDEEIKELSLRYAVSREVIVRRLLTLGLVNEIFYRQKREEYQLENKGRSRKPGFILPATNTISLAGYQYVRLVIDAFNSGKITTSDVSDFLDVRLKHLKRIEDTVGVR